jgi:hypothetical protein
MEKEIELLDWYNKLNEGIEGEGIAKITVPVLDTDDGKPHGFPPDVDTEEEKPPVEIKIERPDPVEDKDKSNSLVSFVATRRIQDILVKLADLEDPYEKDSEERQGLVDSAKGLYIKLGEYISSL